jgi:hypothetical integral membrane protein (TIGR02206 family)
VAAFRLFSPAHLAALALTAAAAAALTVLVRRRPGAAAAVRWALAALLVGATSGFLAATARGGGLGVWDLAPLHLCDFLILVAVYALVRAGPAAAELLWFWGMSGTLLAMVTPDLWETWPDWRFVTYFLLHGGVVAAAAVLTLGVGLHPRPGAPWRVWAFTNLYAAVVGIVDFAFRKNFLYLRHKPGAETILDALGPWPVYILVVDAAALALFLALDAPFSRGRYQASR